MPRKKSAKNEVAIVPEVLPAIPETLKGGQTLDENLLGEAVGRINQIYSRSGLEAALEIGRYALGTFFDGDPANFREHRDGHATFRQLAKHQDLLVSHVWIWRAVSIVGQLPALPERASTDLPYTHHTLLLPVKDHKAKAKLAQEAIEKGLSKRAFEVQVEKVLKKQKGGSKAGRPALAAYVKTINKIEKLTDDNDALWGGLDDLANLDKKEAKRLYQAVTGMKLRCEAVQKRLAGEIPGIGASE